MESFAGKIAVVTGGGSGIGRALVRQLAAAGAHVAMCDVSEPNMAETKSLAAADSVSDVWLTTFVADVSDPDQMDLFGQHVRTTFDCEHINLLCNNAGIGGAGSFLTSPRADWERTFGVVWNGVYNGCRTFAPMLVASEEGHLVNVSSVNGFWATLGPDMAHTAYSAGKFAVKGFTEALINDFRLHAPHVGVSVVMPGHIGTSIVLNSAEILGHRPEDMTAEELAEMRTMATRRGLDVSAVSDDELRGFVKMQGEFFRDSAPTSAEEAATVILDGVRANQWRILIGDDARVLDELVRASPEEAYERSFSERQLAQGGVGIQI